MMCVNISTFSRPSFSKTAVYHYRGMGTKHENYDAIALLQKMYQGDSAYSWWTRIPPPNLWDSWALNRVSFLVCWTSNNWIHNNNEKCILCQHCFRARVGLYGSYNEYLLRFFYSLTSNNQTENIIMRRDISTKTELWIRDVHASTCSMVHTCI